MTSGQAALRLAWGDYLAGFGNYAVTLAYNPHLKGTASPCYRITRDGEYLRLGGSGVSARYGVNRITTVRHIPMQQVHRDLDRVHWQVDRKLFGCRFTRLAAEDRTAFVGLIEHPGTNLHVHLAWRVPEARVTEFAATITDAWKATSPSATIDVQPIRDREWGHYIAKDQRGVALDDASLFVASRPATRN